MLWEGVTREEEYVGPVSCHGSLNFWKHDSSNGSAVLYEYHCGFSFSLIPKVKAFRH